MDETKPPPRQVVHPLLPVNSLPATTSSSPSMKRKAVPEQPDTAPKRAPRQDPVSCELCRRKKLKCNRQQPCSSCVTRRLACSYAVASSDMGVQKTAAQPAPNNVNDMAIASSAPEGVQQQQQQQLPGVVSRPVSDGQASRDKNESLMTADWLEKIVMSDRMPTAFTVARGRMAESSTPQNVSSLGPGTTTAGNMLSTSRGDWTTASRENPLTVQLISYLPKEAEAMALFRYYTSYIDYLYHIILPDRVEEQIHAIYQAIQNQEPLNLNHLALLFSILASSLFLQLSIESSVYAEACSREYTFLTGAALIQSNYPAYPTIEGLQATMIVMHNLSNMNTHPLVSALFIHGAIISQAKNLMLHCIDSPRWQEEGRTNAADMMDVELKRRLWWDLASYDWLLGYLSGPQECTYLINPNHMNVQEPANMDDTMTRNGEDNQSLPISTPTNMSYALQRLKLAVVCREIVDATSHEYLRGQEASYDKILELDRKLRQAYSEFPGFFRLDPVSRRKYTPLYQERPVIAWQRCLLHQGFHSRLCRLHRQYLIRGARDPTYSYSHVVCLQSARKVLEIKRIMDDDVPTFMPPSSVVWSVMHHVFMAAVILLMDVCFNWDDILADKRKEEVLDACRMLSKAQQSSSVVREGIDAMMGVLQKHWKSGKHPATIASSPVINPMVLENCAPASSESHNIIPDVKESSTDLLDDNGEKHLEDIWTEMLDSSGNLSFDTPDWTGLLTELTNVTMPCG